MLPVFTEQLRDRQCLTRDQVKQAVTQLTTESVPAYLKAQFLTQLADKGESTEEIAAFASELRELSVHPVLDASVRDGEILDVCGTGGDRLNTFNISTTVAFIAAAAGIAVAKHGNRAITSASGSADVLEALGIRITLTPEQAAASLREHQFAFFFAPQYQPAFKHIAPARSLCAQKGQRTIFNVLGPLLNPVRPSAQLLGVPRPHFCKQLAKVLQSIGVRRGMVVCGTVGDAYLDELSTLGSTTVSEFYHDRAFTSSELSPAGFPLQAARLEDLAGGDRTVNAEILRRILRGEDRGPRREAVLLNASAALFVAGKTKSMMEGWEAAAALIESGRAIRKLEELVSASRSLP